MNTRREPTPLDRQLASEAAEALERAYRNTGGRVRDVLTQAQLDALRFTITYDLYTADGSRMESPQLVRDDDEAQRTQA